MDGAHLVLVLGIRTRALLISANSCGHELSAQFHLSAVLASDEESASIGPEAARGEQMEREEKLVRQRVGGSFVSPKDPFCPRVAEPCAPLLFWLSWG